MGSFFEVSKEHYEDEIATAITVQVFANDSTDEDDCSKGTLLSNDVTAEAVDIIDGKDYPPPKNVENGWVGETTVTFSDYKASKIYTANGDCTCLDCLTTKGHMKGVGPCNSDGLCTATKDNNGCYAELPYTSCDCDTRTGTGAETDGTVEFCVRTSIGVDYAGIFTTVSHLDSKKKIFVDLSANFASFEQVAVKIENREE